jgi:hypothetical protein
VWRQVGGTSPRERRNKQVRRRTGAAGVFPGRGAVIRLAGAVLAGPADDRTGSRRQMGLEIPRRLPESRRARYGTE